MSHKMADLSIRSKTSLMLVIAVVSIRTLPVVSVRADRQDLVGRLTY